MTWSIKKGLPRCKRKDEIIMRKENRRHGLYLKIGVKKIVRLCFGDETREGSNEC